MSTSGRIGKAMSEDDSKRLTTIMMAEMRAQGDGQHAIEPFLIRVFDRCQEAGLSVTMQDVRREFRDSAGYP